MHQEVMKKVARVYFFRTGFFIEDKISEFKYVGYGFSIKELIQSGYLQERFKIFLDSLNIRELNLSHLHINDLTGLNMIENVASIASLDLMHNELEKLSPRAFDKLTKVKHLNLSFNKLVNIPAHIFDKLAEVKALFLNDNKLVGLPVGVFDKLTEITRLNLYGNELKTLPLGIFKKNENLKRSKISIEKHLFDDLEKREREIEAMIMGDKEKDSEDQDN